LLIAVAYPVCIHGVVNVVTGTRSIVLVWSIVAAMVIVVFASITNLRRTVVGNCSILRIFMKFLGILPWGRTLANLIPVPGLPLVLPANLRLNILLLRNGARLRNIRRPRRLAVLRNIGKMK